METLIAKYYAAKAADDAFQAALVKQFGPTAAGDYRYLPHTHNADVAAAREAFRKAVAPTHSA